MEQALALAALGEGTTSPNPRVGCVVVRDGEPVGSGYHRAPGLPHAEARALEAAGERARGATMYINLEPCAHHGRTPPCAEHLVRSGIGRVVASAVDPNPLVDGRGFARLREHGVEVEVGLLEPEARRLNAAFYHWHATGRPRVTLKAAVTLDGMLAAREGRSRWVSGPAARRFAHRLRMRHDAVLVGAGTLRHDDPRLTVRLRGVDAPRLRAVIAPGLRLDPGARLFAGRGPGQPLPVVYVQHDLASAAERPFRERAEIVRLPGTAQQLDLGALLDDLARREVQSLLVEGGGRTLGSFLRAGLADEAALIVAPKLFASRHGTPLLDLPAVDGPGAGWRVEIRQELRLGGDRALLGPIRSAAGGS